MSKTWFLFAAMAISSLAAVIFLGFKVGGLGTTRTSIDIDSGRIRIERILWSLHEENIAESEISKATADVRASGVGKWVVVDAVDHGFFNVGQTRFHFKGGDIRQMVELFPGPRIDFSQRQKDIHKAQAQRMLAALKRQDRDEMRTVLSDTFSLALSEP